MTLRLQRNAMRDARDLSGIWRCKADPDDTGRGHGWACGLPAPTWHIAVPGSWNEQLAEAGLMNDMGPVWFETETFVPSSLADRHLVLRFSGVDYEAEVWVDGVAVGRSGAQHLPFECPVPEGAAADRSIRIVVRVEALLPEQGPTQRVTREDYEREGRVKDEYWPAVRFDFFPFGGINRAVHLLALPKARIQTLRLIADVGDVDVRAGTGQGTLTLSGAVSDAIETLRVVVTAAGVEPRVFELPCPGGQIGGRLAVGEVGLWSPASPRLYEVRLEAQSDGAPVDLVCLRTGFRKIEVTANQLLLNGQPVTLKGFGKHEDSPISGRGVNLPFLVKDFGLLRWCGANSVRTSHYPYDEAFYDLCDEQGVLVIDEVFSINLDFRKVAPAGLAAHKEAVSALFERDGHHPCVIAWSLANEPGYLGEPVYATASEPYWKALFAHARALDPTRPMTHANVQYASEDDPAFVESDFLTVNRYYGWYTEPGQLSRATVRLRTLFDRLSARHRKPIFVAEFGADAIAGYHATTDQLWTEDYQSDFIDAYWREIVAHPAVIGGHVWNFADFRTAQHGRRAVLNHKGVFTRQRDPKRAAFTVRRLWRDADPNLRQAGDGPAG